MRSINETVIHGNSLTVRDAARRFRYRNSNSPWCLHRESHQIPSPGVRCIVLQTKEIALIIYTSVFVPRVFSPWGGCDYHSNALIVLNNHNINLNAFLCAYGSILAKLLACFYSSRAVAISFYISCLSLFANLSRNLITFFFFLFSFLFINKLPLLIHQCINVWTVIR